MFYVFEGIDGSGKSTQAARFARVVETRTGRRVVELREPGGTHLGEKIRALVLDPTTGDLSAAEEVFLFMSARAHLCRARIAPALGEGSIVVADRFLPSSVVYQGIVGGVGRDAVIEMGRIAGGGVEPRATFVIDLEPDVAFQRLGAQRDRMESRGVEFQRRVRDAYLELAASRPEEFSVIDGSGSADEVHHRVIAEYERLEGGAGAR